MSSSHWTFAATGSKVKRMITAADRAAFCARWPRSTVGFCYGANPTVMSERRRIRIAGPHAMPEYMTPAALEDKLMREWIQGLDAIVRQIDQLAHGVTEGIGT